MTVLGGVRVNPLGRAAALGSCAGSRERSQGSSAAWGCYCQEGWSDAPGCVGGGFVWGKRVTSKCSNLLNPLLAKMKGCIISPRKERTFEDQGSPVC